MLEVFGAHLIFADTFGGGVLSLSLRLEASILCVLLTVCSTSFATSFLFSSLLCVLWTDGLKPVCVSAS